MRKINPIEGNFLNYEREFVGETTIFTSEMVIPITLVLFVLPKFFFKAENFECSECGSQFDSPEGLTTHLDQHEWAEKGAPPATDPSSNCVMCNFSVDSDLAASDKYRQMADHVISAHFNASWPTLNPPQMPPPFHQRQKHDLIKQQDETGEEVSDRTKLRCVHCTTI